MSMKSLIPIATIILLTGSIVVAQSRLRPGLYEMVDDISLDGKSTPSSKVSACITAQDLKDMTKLLTRGAEEQECKISDLVSTGDRLTFVMTCNSDGVRVVSRGEMSFGTETYSIVTTTKVEGEVVTYKRNAKRTGDCK